MKGLQGESSVLRTLEQMKMRVISSPKSLPVRRGEDLSGRCYTISTNELQVWEWNIHVCGGIARCKWWTSLWGWISPVIRGWTILREQATKQPYYGQSMRHGWSNCLRGVIKYGVVLSCESKFVVVCSLCGSARPKRGYVLHYVRYYKRGSYPLVIVRIQDIIYSFDLLS